jgi:hypothetical protein
MKWLALVLLCLGCSGDDEGDVTASRRSRCSQLRDHLVELRLATATNVDVAAHRAVMRRALGDEFVTRCETSTSEDVVNCALAATDSSAAAACSDGAAGN